MNTKTAQTLEAGDELLNTLTGEVSAVVAKVTEVRGRFVITFTDGREFPHVSKGFKFEVSS